MTKDEIISQIKELKAGASFTSNFWASHEIFINSQYYAGKHDAYDIVVSLLEQLEDCNNDKPGLL
jgi:hypothetical protein